MLRPRFFTGRPLRRTRAKLELEGEAARHIARTLRMRVGERLCLFDGGGQEAAATITAIARDSVSVDCEAALAVDRESPLSVELAIAVSRGERMDTVVQKATELGVARLRPLLSERVGVRLDPARWQKKHRHWQRVAISACEQCGRNRLPQIDPPTALAALLAEPLRCELALLLHPGGGAGQTLPERCRSLRLLVGPEGGFSDDEVTAALAAGYRPLQLGPRILRTETAPLAALSLAQARWGDLR